jgi:hypothetical protein
LKNLARDAGTLAAKDTAPSAHCDFHLNQVVQVPDHVSPFQLPLLALAAQRAAQFSLKKIDFAVALSTLSN